MFNSAVLEVFLGLAFVYLVLSLICSILHEVVAFKGKWRESILNKGIERLLPDEQVRDSVLAHPLIASLHEKGRLPASIPRSLFASALLEVAKDLPDGPEAEGELPDGSDDPEANPEGEELKRFLRSLLGANAEPVDGACNRVEEWFDASMANASFVYRRHSRCCLFVLGLLAAGLMNVDTFHIAGKLWRDPALRSEVALAASNLVEKIEKEQERDGKGQTSGDKAESAEAGNGAKELAEELAALKRELTRVSLPIGWGSGGRMSWGYLPIALLGWVFTALAVSLGAPFWFDIVKRFVRLREGTQGEKKSE